jgi:arabinofuranan 3-O-arabinosyltransferase
LLTGRALVEPGEAADAAVVTDTRRRRALNPGADPDRRYSATLPAAADPVRADVDAVPVDRQSTEVLDGAEAVTASSSGSDPYAVAYRGPDRRPEAAVDGDPATAWLSDLGTVGQWLELRLAEPADPGTATVRMVDDPAVGPQVAGIRVDTDAGSVTAPVPAGGEVRVRLPPGRTTTVRLTVTAVSGPGSGSVGVRELAVAGVRVEAAVAVPASATALTAGRPWTVLATRPDGARPDCVRADAGWVCVPGLATAGEETGPLSRRFGTADPAVVAVDARLRPRAGPRLDALLDSALGYRASASSVIVTSPAARAGAAYDGDDSTAWMPVDSDPAPQLRLDLSSTVTLAGLRLSGTAADYAGVARVVLSTPSGTRTLRPVPGLSQRFPPVRARTVVLTFQRSARADALPERLRVRDVALAGAPARRSGPVAVSCADGPAAGLDGAVRRFSLRARPADLLSLAPVAATPCGAGVPLGAGQHRLTTSRTTAFDVDSLSVAPVGAAPAPPAGRAVTVERDGAESRTVRVAPGDAGYLALTEGYNAGWRAIADGRELRPVRLDGWRQGWALPAGGTTAVELTFTPGRTHRLGLLLGLLAALALVPLALVGPRRRARAPEPEGDDPLAAPAGAARRRDLRVRSAVAGAVVGGVLAGGAGVVVGVAVGFVPGRWRAAAAGGALALAGIVLAVAPGWSAQPELTQLLAVGALCLAAAGWAAGRADDAAVDPAVDPARGPAGEPVGEPQRRALDDDPGQRGDPDRPEHGEHRDREHATAEGLPPGQ